MVLYIEYVIFDNMVVDYLLVNLLSTTFKEKFNKFRKFLTCCIGTIFAVFLPYIKYSFWINIYRAITLVVMMLFLKKYKSLKNYLMFLSVFVGLTVFFGGVALGILIMFGMNYSLNGILLYNSSIPVGAFILIFWIGGWLLKKIIITLNNQIKYNNFLHHIVLCDNGNCIEGVGFFDSGNKVDRSGEVVNIISMDMFMKLYKDYPIEKLLFRNIDSNKLKNASYIDIQSISVTSKCLAFTIDKMIIDQQEYNNVTLAVVMKNFKSFDCIINSNMEVCKNE